MITWNDNAAAVLDREAALSRVGGDAELLKEIGELFLREYTPAIAELRTAVAQRDPKGIERKAHSLKGAVSTFGSGPAYMAALDLEKLGRSGDLAQVDVNMERFETSLTRLCCELKSLISE